MRFGWARVAAIGLVLAVAACGRDAPAPDEAAKQAAAEAEFFLKSNARQPGVVTLPSGLQYKVVASGPSGAASPDSNDLVRVDYEGSLTDGTIFDSSFQNGSPVVFTPEAVVPGWTEALQRMKVGDEWLLYVPPALGYGEQGRPPVIPGNSVLVFRLKLLDVATTPGGRSGVGSAMG